VHCRRITQRRQLAHGHQNLNVMFREAEEPGCLRNIQPRRQTSHLAPNAEETRPRFDCQSPTDRIGAKTFIKFMRN